MVVTNSQVACLIGEHYAPLTAVDKNSWDYKSIKNKTISVLKVLTKSENVKKYIVTADTNVDLVILDAIAEYKKSIDNGFCPEFELILPYSNLIFRNEEELKAFENCKSSINHVRSYILSDDFNSDENNDIPLESKMKMKIVNDSDIVIALVNEKRVNRFDGVRRKFEGGASSAITALNYALKINKDVRVVDTEEASYRKLY